MVIVYVTFLFAVMKLMDVFVHKSPIVISNEDVNPDQADDELDTGKEDFMMAFALEDYYLGSKSDPRYVQWLARLIIQTEDNWETVNYPLHPCSKEELDNFY